MSDALTLPCSTCSSTGTDTHEDRHTGTKQDTCRTCGGTGMMPARAGETPEASFIPEASAMTHSQTSQDQDLRTARDVETSRKGDWMQTFTGRRFWPLDPRGEDVIIEDIAHALSLLTRYGGHCTRFYSVAEHSVLLARAASPENALWLLLHDASEAYLSDMVRPLKRHMPEYRAAEDRVAWAVYEAFRLDPGAEPAEVKALDNRILMDERAQVMSPTGDTWNYGGARDPLGVTLQFWSPERAEREFLTLFSELTGLSVALPALTAPPRPDHAGGVEHQDRLELAALEAGANGGDWSVRQQYANRWLLETRPNGPEFIPLCLGTICTTILEVGCTDAQTAENAKFIAAAVRYVRKHVLGTPAQAPDKAGEREGVEADREQRALTILRRMCADERLVLEQRIQETAFWKSALEMADKDIAALAHQPNGTDTSRGVIPAGWKLVPEEPTEAMIQAYDRACWAKLKDAYNPCPTEHPEDGGGSFGYGWRALLAATPTPPLSPDSTGPADLCHDEQLAIWSGDIIGSLGMGGYLREDLSYDDKLHMYALVDAEVKGICAAPTPSAPIAAPVRDDEAREGAPETIARLEKEFGVTGTAAVFREALRRAKEARENTTCRMLDEPAVKAQLRDNAELMRGEKNASAARQALARLTSLASIGDHELRGDMEPEDGEDEVSRLYRTALASLPAPAGDVPGEAQTERVRHVKRGTEYEVLFRGVPLQIAVGSGCTPNGNCLHEGDMLVIYRGTDGLIWARGENEFRDGRFATLLPGEAQTQEGER